MDLVEGFQFGAVSKIGACCGKPVGCTMRPSGCQWPQHPWKRKFIDQESPLICGPCGRGGHECPEMWRGLCDCEHCRA